MASGIAISHHSRRPNLRYTSRDPMNEGKSVGSAISCAPSTQPWPSHSIFGTTSRTMWWPSGVSSELRGSWKQLYGSSWCPCSTRTLRPPGRIRSTSRHSLAPVISRTASAALTSQARSPSWLPIA